MPQVWLTYEELGEHFRCEPSEARENVIENAWPRRRCSDQLTRVKLPPGLTHEFMLTYANKFGAAMMTTDQMVADLRSVLALAHKEPLALPAAQSEPMAQSA